MKNIHVFISILILFNSPIVAQDRFRRNPPLPEPLPTLNLPRIESNTLTNGFTVSVIRRTNLPIITSHLLIYTGESLSPVETPGLATFTANMLDKGSQNLSSAEIQEHLESIGGSFSTETFPEYTVITFSFLDDHLDQALELLKEILLFPAFSQREIENTKRTMYYTLLNKTTNTEFVGKRLLYQILFKGHAYQNYTFGSDVIKNINRSAVSSFFYEYYRPKNAHLFLTGNISLPNATIRVSRYLNTWRGGNRNRIGIPPPKANEKTKICFINVPNAKNAVIVLGNQLPPKSSNIYFSLIVMNQVLGGSHLNRLFMNLREAKGYAYWAYSTIDFFKACGIFCITARVRPEAVYDSVLESLREINALFAQKIPNYELEQAKTNIIGNFPIQLEESETLTSRISENQALSLGRGHWDQYYGSIMVIDSQTVFEAVRLTALRTPVVVIAGDISVLDHMLEFNEVEIYDAKGDYQYSIKEGQS